MKLPTIDTGYLVETLLKLLFTPSPSGYTDRVVHLVCQRLEQLGVPFELTRRGAIRATLEGKVSQPDRAVVAHIDTLGAMVKALKDNGRLQLVPVGHWNARFAEGARATLFTDTGQWRGTILPLKASGHTFAPEIDNQPGGWDYVEFRIDARVHKLEDLLRLGVHVGDFLAIDTTPEITDTGFINSRHLDDKAGAAVLLAAIEAVRREGLELPVDCHPLFTISEEVGSGASAALHQDVAEMLTIDNGTSAPGQNSSEFGVTIAMADQSGPFDYHLTHRLIQLCQEFAIPHQRDVFKYYRSDSAAALEAGNDVRTALITFGVDASHGYERIHLDALESLARLVAAYMQGPPLFSRDRLGIGPLTGFPIQPG
ncbi:osmoprotectant NAGGN system M42 family peptidase [Allochromatium vinosum]|uniref:osmoprotectant NAGGN system M42 family peptidase n=1 Tax=Allochromatium vinosum TaxID=1049 RepID=UPI0019076685|nr:osmoprotectant NAGGN system M42 family peptidase [Allochromatium vinosum]MBK1653441.1 osmoprotectant NAGGN system M42 family peptidase [Allochromatium vinosum]